MSRAMIYLNLNGLTQAVVMKPCGRAGRVSFAWRRWVFNMAETGVDRPAAGSSKE